MNLKGASSSLAASWDTFEDGYIRDTTTAQNGTASIKLTTSSSDGASGACEITCEISNHVRHQGVYPPEDNNVFYMLLVTAWSLASNISGDKDSGYSLYIDITYTDDTNLWGQIIQVRQTNYECKNVFIFVQFATGTHGWQMGSIIITPAKPISSLDVYCLLRDGHTGTAWFDNVQIYSISPLSFGSASVQVLFISCSMFYSPEIFEYYQLLCFVTQSVLSQLKCQVYDKQEMVYNLGTRRTLRLLQLLANSLQPVRQTKP